MGASTATEGRVRVLGLGNELLADDGIGILAALETGRRFGGAIDVVCSGTVGFDLVEELGTGPCAIVVDAVVTGSAAPGTLHLLTEAGIDAAPGGAVHGMGLPDALAAARRLGLTVPRLVIIIGVEVADCTTVGGAMHPDVRAAAARVADAVGEVLAARDRYG